MSDKSLADKVYELVGLRIEPGLDMMEISKRLEEHSGAFYDLGIILEREYILGIDTGMDVIKLDNDIDKYLTGLK